LSSQAIQSKPTTPHGDSLTGLLTSWGAVMRRQLYR
jgi:hypothetical protein